MLYELQNLRLLSRPPAGAAQPLPEHHTEDLGSPRHQAGRLLDHRHRQPQPPPDLLPGVGQPRRARAEVRSLPGRSRVDREARGEREARERRPHRRQRLERHPDADGLLQREVAQAPWGGRPRLFRLPAVRGKHAHRLSWRQRGDLRAGLRRHARHRPSGRLRSRCAREQRRHRGLPDRPTSSSAFSLDASHPSPRRLRLYHAPAAGVDAIDRSRLPAGTPLCCCFGHDPAIAEYVMTALLLRHVPIPAADRDLRQGKWTYWASSPRGTAHRAGRRNAGHPGLRPYRQGGRRPRQGLRHDGAHRQPLARRARRRWSTAISR